MALCLCKSWFYKLRNAIRGWGNEIGMESVFRCCGSLGHRLCMGLPVRYRHKWPRLRGHLAHTLFSKPPSGLRESFAEPLYQRIEQCLATGSQGCGKSWHTSRALGLDSYSQCHCVVPTIASPNKDSHQMDGGSDRMEEETSKVQMRVVERLAGPIVQSMRALHEALK